MVEEAQDAAEDDPYAQYYVVQKGDSLSKIAKEFYGDMSLYPKIFEANGTSWTTPTRSSQARGCGFLKEYVNNANEIPDCRPVRGQPACGGCLRQQEGRGSQGGCRCGCQPRLRAAGAGCCAAAQQEQAAASAEWATLSTDLPKMVSAIQSRVDILSQVEEPAGERVQGIVRVRQAGAGRDQRTVGAKRPLQRHPAIPWTPWPRRRVVQEKGHEVLALLGMSGG